MPECSTPLLRPLACIPTDVSFSKTMTLAAGCLRFSSRATARPTIPAPTTTKSADRRSIMNRGLQRHILNYGILVRTPPLPRDAFGESHLVGTAPHDDCR